MLFLFTFPCFLINDTITKRHRRHMDNFFGEWHNMPENKVQEQYDALFFIHKPNEIIQVSRQMVATCACVTTHKLRELVNKKTLHPKN